MSGIAYEIDVRSLDELSPRDLYAMLKMRLDVFVVEQKCAFPEMDGKDPEALHLRLLAGKELLASTRILAPSGHDDPAYIGRVVVSPDHRGKRLGNKLMAESIAACERLFPDRPIALSAQSHLEKFYASFGFDTVSDEYLEDDIPHVDMLRPVPRARA
ncbi:GNAT family N-acetyltransferase [Aminobacter sp. Y103A]|uniref:GNAT family N-acetyltransferase n=1 Tax=Aminobacter sp. Y103A TaxID=1870862 RepID=UPI0025725CE3|nr:GNAT family N-acetyltransferase [Aminobacter sp. SS-2016]BBD38117.1 GNAT family N-acetyltransferase [Aminobacter sp. SS-2016]